MNLDSLPITPKTQDSLMSSEAESFYNFGQDVANLLTANKLPESENEIKEREKNYLNIESVRFLYW